MNSINICYCILTTHIKYSFTNGSSRTCSLILLFKLIFYTVFIIKILLRAGRSFCQKSCNRIQPANANTDLNHYRIELSPSELFPAPVVL